MTTALDDHNEDWPKQTWDLYYDGAMVTDMAGLLWALRLEGLPIVEQHKALRHFDTLPAAQAMPDELREEFDKIMNGDSDDE